MPHFSKVFAAFVSVSPAIFDARFLGQARRSGALSEAALAEPSLLAQPELEAEYGRGAWVLQPPQAWGYCPRTLGLKVRTFRLRFRKIVADSGQLLPI